MELELSTALIEVLVGTTVLVRGVLLYRSVDELKVTLALTGKLETALEMTVALDIGLADKLEGITVEYELVNTEDRLVNVGNTVELKLAIEDEFNNELDIKDDAVIKVEAESLTID